MQTEPDECHMETLWTLAAVLHGGRMDALSHLKIGGRHANFQLGTLRLGTCHDATQWPQLRGVEAS
jgi:hypothetical protein